MNNSRIGVLIPLVIGISLIAALFVGSLVAEGSYLAIGFTSFLERIKGMGKVALRDTSGLASKKFLGCSKSTRMGNATHSIFSAFGVCDKTTM
jgi:hypothetical protein